MTTSTSPTRIEYIDAIKGFSILWVVIFHLGEIVPDWLAAPYRMPLFFFMSGIFFRYRPFKEFLARRVNTLLIPLAIWLIITWLYMIFKYEILSLVFTVPIEYQGPTWTLISDVLKLRHISNDYVFTPFLSNSPLWFLLGLFNVQMIFYGLRQLTSKTWFILAISAVLYVVGRVMELNSINGLFLVSISFQYVLYYALGAISGNQLIEFIKDRRNTRLLLIICLPILIVLPFVDLQIWGYNTVSIMVRAICFVPLVFIIFSKIYDLKILKPLIFFGRNSLVVLATHSLIFGITTSFVVKIVALWGDFEHVSLSLYYNATLFLLVCFINYYIIKFCNRYAPWAVGKTNVIKLK